MQRNLAGQAAAGADVKRKFATDLSQFADVFRAAGNSPEALDYHQESLELFDSLLDADGRNEGLLRDQGIAFGRAATTCIAMEHWDEALETAEGAVIIFSRLAESNPDDDGRKYDLALALQRRAAALAAIGASVGAPAPQAMGDAEGSRRLLQGLVDKYPSNRAWSAALAASEHLFARFWRKRGPR
jgi:tetratricopeptide (TPR) repeat protein